MTEHRAGIHTLAGRVVATATDAGITRLAFSEAAVDDSDPHPHLSHLADELDRYFDGRLEAFTVPLADPVGTPFQVAAWRYLRSVPFGQTRTYGQQAAAIRAPNAARAVGRANGANPLCLIVPCHRVVGATGSLTGFAYGIHIKLWLLHHERRVAGIPLDASPQCS